MRHFLPYIFMLLFMSIIVGGHIYLSRRFGWYFGVENLRSFYWTFALLIIYMIGGLAGFTNSMSRLGGMIYGSAAFLMGFALYLLFFTLLLDLLQIMIKVPRPAYGIAVLAFTLGVSLYGVLNAFTIRTRHLELQIPELQQELKIMHWTDIHLGHFRGAAFLEGLVQKANTEGVDAVLITGDLFDGKVRFGDSTLAVLKELKAPTWFVEGNHDGYSGVTEVKQGLRDVGVHVLSNQVEKWKGIQLVGLNHMLADESSMEMHSSRIRESGDRASGNLGSRDQGGRPTIRSTLNILKPDPAAPSILLHHSPDGIEYAQAAGIDLYLCGHTHAGQLFPVNLIGELIYQFNEGLHDHKGTRIYVGSGAGTFGPPMRIGTHSTVTVFKLKP